MERFLLLWDEIDEVGGWCRHIAIMAAHEVSTLAAPAVSYAAVVVTATATAWTACRDLFRIS